jgi:branched-chain amino acid transport system permease protein
MLGPFAGSAFFLLLNEALMFAATALGGVSAAILSYVILARDVFFGLIFILFVVFEPRGIAHRWGLIKNYYRMAPFSY